MQESLTIKNVRYFETGRGVGYEAKTDKGTIWNDGNGGETYFTPNLDKYSYKDFEHLNEFDLEMLLDNFENITR